ncbi:bifunctional diaminohydroxyphosphoribosylaminopyrimidine deaminase/5-amino-6-(5-phosphoribosylamino)uracil reductase RibD [Flavobacterium pallidum]|uniref:Riboflavin biosynthesis protein RibD n=1 Tax=Flavobacterium pallidum TaxID=2172098 RepID=A0A2S1SL27_9FLAO|nr:bifunctional diaminohydroxyphosphoribosylaminopyrimidine deaminase/5-amino-6-(5-phosphoribosylamino)uracil reductase RibD [Flavobacterium pallidum]AWI27113.1 bifunctional diaminohydroxyphosphoribosylaminopyrimidine deaminase/5-amino-6-(5-phosphoribosylamino)uracil reductase RibD [Flavobacterium pallidum]
MTIHEKFMRRCLELAQNGLGTTYPNPLVGSVIVHEGKIIGEGWHRKAGEPHAEVNAINSVKDTALLEKSAIYVNLEPCSHFGKTPPCCDLIISKKIPEIIIGITDPHSKVAGEGIRRLQEAGKKVTIGVLEKDCSDINKRFFTFHNKKRPYIILKWAETPDGFIAPKTKSEIKPVWITNETSRQLVHKWRSEEHAILIGTQTAVDDNPTLTTRDWAGKNPVRIVIDRHNRIPKENHIFDNQAETILISGTEIDFNENCAAQIAEYLYKRNIQSVIIEGGRKTLQTFIDAGFWDEARIFKGKIPFGDGVKAPDILGTISETHSISGDELLMLTNNDQHNYF